MGYYLVGVCQGEISNGVLTQASRKQLEETANLLKGSKISRRLPKKIYSNNSPEGIASAEYLVDLLDIKGVPARKIFRLFKSKKLIKIVLTLPVITEAEKEKWVKTMEKAVGEGDPLSRYLKPLPTEDPFSISVDIVTADALLLRGYLEAFYRNYEKSHLLTEEKLSLMPGEAFISEQHYDWGTRVKEIFLSKKIVDVLIDEII